MGSVPNCQKEIPTCYAIRWFKCKLKPPKNQEHKEKPNKKKPVLGNDEPGKSSTKGKPDGDISKPANSSTKGKPDGNISKPGKSSKKEKTDVDIQNNKTEEKEKKQDGKRKKTGDDNHGGWQSKKLKTVNLDSKHTGRSLRSRTINSVDDPDTSNPYKTDSEFEEDGAQDEGFRCHICNKTFARVDEFKDHKSICTKLKKKWTCPKCSKGSTQKTLLDQHYDYYHTSKPKQFICKPCNKDFPLKKSYLEHNRHLHNDADYKYVCEICGRGFFVKGEYTCHHLSHTKLKPYACGVCQKAASGTPGQLNAHVNRCGKEPEHECSKCWKKMSSKQSLEKHVREHHNKQEVQGLYAELFSYFCVF